MQFASNATYQATYPKRFILFKKSISIKLKYFYFLSFNFFFIFKIQFLNELLNIKFSLLTDLDAVFNGLY